MRLKNLVKSTWTICSPIDESIESDDPEYKPLSFIEGYLNVHHNDKGLTKLIETLERFGEHGSRGFTDSSVHEVDSKNNIYQLRKGDHRFLYFNGGHRKVVIMAAPHRKSGKKVSSKEVNKMIDIKEDYEKGLRANQIEIMEE